MKSKGKMKCEIAALNERTSLLFSPLTQEEQQEEGQVVGIENEVQIVTSELIAGSASLGVVSILGAERIGKTSLAKKVYDSPVISCHFPFRLWVTFKRNPGNGSSTNYIQFPEDTLYHNLLINKYLIVLDDVQSPKEWNTLQQVFPETWNGSRILITTRNKYHIDSGPNWSFHEKRLLSEEEGWELFNANLGYRVPLELEDIGKEVVSKCMGLPPTISHMGQLLSQKAANQEQWSLLLKQMSGEQVALYFNLKTIADSLAPNLKQCLFYFGLFRQDYDIPARRLIVLWVAEGLVQQEKGDKEQPECLAEKLLTKLIRHNLIQVAKWKHNGRVKTCRMNYFLRDKWLSNAREANFLHWSNSSSGSGKAMQLSDLYDYEDRCFSHIHGRETLKKSSFQRYYKDISSFLSFDSREGPDPGDDIGNFLRRGIASGCFKKLKVIDLEGVFQPKLPESLGQVIELRYLGLRSTYIEMLPSSIGKLMNLQTLDLKTTKIHALPTSLWKMKQLRHLYLSESYRCRFVPPSAYSSLVDLQTLWGAFIDEETLIGGGLDRLINLRKLGLVCMLTTTQQIEVAEWIMKLKHLESLRLRSIDRTFVQPSNLYLKPLPGLDNLSSMYLYGRLEKPSVVHYLPQCIAEMTLSLAGLAEDPMPKLEKLPHLRILNLYSASYSGKTLVCSSGGFPSLMTLNIWVLEELEEWIVEQGALSILRETEIRSCNRLKMLPDGFKLLRHCRKLKLTRMPHEFKLRVNENQGEDWCKVAHIPSVIIKD